MINSTQPETKESGDQAKTLSDADLDKVSGGIIGATLFLAGMIINTIKPGTIPFLSSFRKEQ